MAEITIVEIAKKCGVGVSTVSRALNNHSDINADYEFDQTDWNEDLSDCNSEFDSNYEFSDNDDRDIDPAYSSMQSNIHHDI